MACLVDKVIVNPRYRKIAPDTHMRLYHPEVGFYPKKDYFVKVDCGRCINCFRKYMSAWRFRLLHEFYNLSRSQLCNSYFVTLTIEPKYYSEKPVVLKKMVRRFLERVRKHCGKSVRHFLVTERGEEGNRLHFHGFFIDPSFDVSLTYNLWYYGFVEVVPVVSTEYPLSQRVSYCTSYVTKGKKGKVDDIILPENWPVVLVSPGLGKSYAQNPLFNHSSPVLYPMTAEFNGTSRSLPRYLRQKVFTEDELKTLKDDYFNNYSYDVIPDPPYYIGNVEYTDYTVYLRDIKFIQFQYKKIYGKQFGRILSQSSQK